MKKKILIVNGPNLNLLGKREVKFYGRNTLEDIENSLKKEAQNLGVEIEFFQSNYEGELIEKIHSTDADFIIINPAGLTHTSVSLRDALKSVNIPFIEVHLSNIYSREPFRRKSLFSDIAKGVISGFKEMSYKFALEGAVEFLREENKSTS